MDEPSYSVPVPNTPEAARFFLVKNIAAQIKAKYPAVVEHRLEASINSLLTDAENDQSSAVTEKILQSSVA